MDAANRLNIQFITCGGAFAHATHGLKQSIDLRWARRRTDATRVSDARDPVEFNRTEMTVIRPEGPDVTLQRQMPQQDNTAPAASSPPSEPAH